MQTHNNKSDAVYYSEDRISKTKASDENFRKAIKEDEKRIIGEYLAKRIVSFKDIPKEKLQ